MCFNVIVSLNYFRSLNCSKCKNFHSNSMFGFPSIFFYSKYSRIACKIMICWLCFSTLKLIITSHHISDVLKQHEVYYAKKLINCSRPTIMKWECKSISPSLLREKRGSIWWVDMINGWTNENWREVLCFVKLVHYMKLSNITCPVIDL